MPPESAMTDKPPSEPDPESWDRFTRAVDAALHTPAKHREGKAKSESSPRKEAPPKRP